MEKMVEQTAHSFQIFFSISNAQDRINALHIYGREKIHELIESLESVPTPSSAELLNEYEKIIASSTTISLPWSTPTVPEAGWRKCIKKKVNQWLTITCVQGFK